MTNNGAAGFYSMMVFIAEGSTPALNLSWLLHQLNMKDTLLFKACAGVLLLSFFVFRVLMSPCMFWHLTVYRDHWGVYNNTMMYWGNWFIVGSFMLLNFFWFYKLLLVAFGGKKSKAAKKKDV
jgi:hypothetical protein